MAVDLRNEMVELRRNLLAMGAAVEQRVTRVIESMIENDLSMAESVKAGDAEIDRIIELFGAVVAQGHGKKVANG